MNTEKLYRDTKSNNKRADWDMKNISKPCAEGCSACCHQSVAVFEPEGLVLERFIQNRLTPSQKAHSKERAESLLSVFNQITRDASIENPLTEEEFRLAEKHMTALRATCPFLEDSSCSVYEARPLVCRTYIVENDPHECAKNPFRGRVTFQGRSSLSIFQSIFD
jgi:Fe-S-cluster containining protein